jgi:hypothetical protein
MAAIDFFFPHPDQHLAAKASFREGICLNVDGQGKGGSGSHTSSISQLNPGGIHDQFVRDIRTADQHNLELLFNHDPVLCNSKKAKARARGKGKATAIRPG